MPSYYFFRKAVAPHPSRASWDYVDKCEDHREAAEKEKTYNAVPEAPLVRRMHAKTEAEARAVVEEYG